jgi:hypothetical protein
VLWEVIFLLVILKIPIVYLCAVVWWAIKAEPTNEPPTEPVTVTDTPKLDPPSWTPRPRTGSPVGRSARRAAGERTVSGRAAVRR